MISNFSHDAPVDLKSQWRPVFQHRAITPTYPIRPPNYKNGLHNENFQNPTLSPKSSSMHLSKTTFTNVHHEINPEVNDYG